MLIPALAHFSQPLSSPPTLHPTLSLSASYNLATVERLYRAWGNLLPRVHPCYAVKCNPDQGLLAVLAAMGAGFDCASEAEIQAVSACDCSSKAGDSGSEQWGMGKGTQGTGHMPGINPQPIIICSVLWLNPTQYMHAPPSPASALLACR